MFECLLSAKQIIHCTIGNDDESGGKGESVSTPSATGIWNKIFIAHYNG